VGMSVGNCLHYSQIACSLAALRDRQDKRNLGALLSPQDSN